MAQIISAEPLAQMIRSITLQKRTGMLRVEQLGERSAERGEIYFENGSLIRVRTEREQGKAALQRIGEWKQITCTFQGMSRPYHATMPLAASAPAQELKVENPQPRPLPQTDRLESMPALMDKETEPRKSVAHQPLSGGEPRTHPLNERRAKIALSAKARSSISSVPTDPGAQPLVVHGTRLENYTPAQVATPTRAVQRWTTHVISEIEMLPAQRNLPPMPYVDEKSPPGRMAIFGVRSAVSAAQAIGQMERHARVVFILLDGRRTIQHIARLTHQTEYEVEHILVDLTQRGYTYYVSG